MIAIVAIVMVGIIQVVGIITGRGRLGSQDAGELTELQDRLEALENWRSESDGEPGIPTRAEIHRAADVDWRLDMVEARLEELEKREDRENKPAPGDPVD